MGKSSSSATRVFVRGLEVMNRMDGWVQSKVQQFQRFTAWVVGIFGRFFFLKC